jgi:nucleoside-diphosphate-sugar epimerase
MSAGRILVTGGSGFTGGHLCRRLVEAGHSVRTMVRNPDRCVDLAKRGVEVVAGDLCDPTSIRNAMQGVDLVYHIAALFRPENVTQQDMWDINVQGTKNMLDAAVGSGVQRFVHCSTIGVHGDVKNAPATEESPYNPGDYYQESKTEGEKIALQYMREGRLPIVVFRPAGIYGPGDTRFLKLVKSIKQGRFVMIGSGTTKYHMIYIDDLVDGILLCGTRENAVNKTYILAGEGWLTLNELVKLIADIVKVQPPRWRIPFGPVYTAGYLCELLCKPFNIDPPLHRRRVDFFRKNRAFSICKAKEELGFQPKVNLAAGLTLTVEWYSRQNLI